MKLLGSFNSKEYAWIDVNVVLLGRPVGGLRGIEYKISRKKEACYGAGKHARGIQYGEITVEGTITLLQSELRALNDAARAKGFDSILDLEFDIIVTYLAEGSVDSETDVVNTVSITEIPKAIKQGDMFQEIALPFIACNVQ